MQTKHKLRRDKLNNDKKHYETINYVQLHTNFMVTITTWD